MDATFLHLESRAQLMHFNGLIVLDPTADAGTEFGFATFRRSLSDAVKSRPEFRRRTIDFAQADLADVKKVENALGVTVNDVVLAMHSGALRAYPDTRGKPPSSYRRR